MNKSFDDLFNEFFNRKKEVSDDRFPKMRDEVKKMIQMLMNFEPIENFGDNLDDGVDTELGPPDEVIERKEGNLYVTYRIWNKPNGQIVRVMVRDSAGVSSEPEAPVTEISLENRLKAAIETEDYEEAAKLRDQINSEKKEGK